MDIDHFYLQDAGEMDIGELVKEDSPVLSNATLTTYSNIDDVDYETSTSMCSSFDYLRYGIKRCKVMCSANYPPWVTKDDTPYLATTSDLLMILTVLRCVV